MPARLIDDDFAHAARAMHAAGTSKEAVARALGCCQRTVRRALAALAAGGAAQAVDGYLLPPPKPRPRQYKPRTISRPVDTGPARLGEECTAFAEALAREAGGAPAYA